MKNKKILTAISVLFVAITMIFSPVYVEAKSDEYIYNLTIKNMAKSDYQIECDADPICKSDALFGNVDCKCSVAWLLQKVLNYLKILGPSIAIVLGSIDFVKAIITSDDDNMKKTEIRFAKRIVAAIILFFIPLFTEIILRIAGLSDYTGGLK